MAEVEQRSDVSKSAMLLTSGGWQTMRTRVANQNKPEKTASNMYLYQLEGVKA